MKKSELRQIIREEIQSLYEAEKLERGDMGYVQKHKSAATVYKVMNGGKKLQVKLGRGGKLVTIDASDFRVMPDID